jgi:hypothetical protein
MIRFNAYLHEIDDAWQLFWRDPDGDIMTFDVELQSWVLSEMELSDLENGLVVPFRYGLASPTELVAGLEGVKSALDGLAGSVARYEAAQRQEA